MALENWKRGAQILATPSYHRYQVPQFLQTLKAPLPDYPASANKRLLVVLPGLSCGTNNYGDLISAVNADFNLLQVTDLPEGLQAITSRKGIEERAHQLLDTLYKMPEGEVVDLVGHSLGGIVAAYAQVIEKNKSQTSSRIGKIVTLSAPLSGSSEISSLPGVSQCFHSVRDLNPESSIMKHLNAEGRIDDRFVTQKDELLKLGEMDFKSGREHLLHTMVTLIICWDQKRSEPKRFKP